MSTEMTNYGDKRMTVKEVAEALGYRPDTIQGKVKELFPELVKNGIATTLTITEVDIIKQNLVPRNLGLKSEVERAVTPLDIERMTLQVIQYHASRIKELETALAVASPKAELADRLTSSEDAIDLGTVSKVLALPFGRNTLFSILRGKKILMSDNRPYQEYMDRGYFRVIEEPFEVKGKTKINFKTLAYQRGVDFIRKTIEAEK